MATAAPLDKPLLENKGAPKEDGKKNHSQSNTNSQPLPSYDGLSTAEAQRRLLRDGYNELAHSYYFYR